ncbi:MAG: hypothetical protein QT00_C0001G0456 [archaeon GW2011_AR5]|nr:MAG: hypothetical protein QT00_C0001G0456 [archaeon GW2011_AR5]
MKRVAGFFAHPDDEAIIAGGSLAKHASLGNDVMLFFMTSGEAGGTTQSPEEMREIRELEARNSGSVLGVASVGFLRYPDGGLVCDQGSISRVVGLIRRYMPNVVYTHYGVDRHSDHRATNAILKEALFRASEPYSHGAGGQKWTVGMSLAGELGGLIQTPTYLEDVSEFMDVKYRALGQHKSQAGEVDYERAFRGLNAYRGLITGSDVEAFDIIAASNLFD